MGLNTLADLFFMERDLFFWWLSHVIITVLRGTCLDWATKNKFDVQKINVYKRW